MLHGQDWTDYYQHRFRCHEGAREIPIAAIEIPIAVRASVPTMIATRWKRLKVLFKMVILLFPRASPSVSSGGLSPASRGACGSSLTFGRDIVHAKQGKDAVMAGNSGMRLLVAVSRLSQSQGTELVVD